MIELETERLILRNGRISRPTPEEVQEGNRSYMGIIDNPATDE